MVSAATAARLREIQSRPGNKTCVDCSQRTPQWASVSYGVFMCLECSGRHRGLGVHISFVRSVTMDSWSEIQFRKMEVGGNDALNEFFAAHGISKDTDIDIKYNTPAAEAYRARIQAAAEGSVGAPPPAAAAGPTAAGSARSGSAAGFGSDNGWADWGGGGGGGGGGRGAPPASANHGNAHASTTGDGGMRRHQSEDSMSGGFAGGGRGSNWVPERRGGGGSGMGKHTGSTGSMYSREEMEASAANKDNFFARKQAENLSRPEGLPPSKGGKYVGFSSTPSSTSRPANRGGGDDVLEDTVKVVSQGFKSLSMAAIGVAGAAAFVVQEGTKDIQAKMREGGYDQKAKETASVVASSAAELGHKAWGFVSSVAQTAVQTVEGSVGGGGFGGGLGGGGSGGGLGGGMNRRDRKSVV